MESAIKLINILLSACSLPLQSCHGLPSRFAQRRPYIAHLLQDEVFLASALSLSLSLQLSPSLLRTAQGNPGRMLYPSNPVELLPNFPTSEELNLKPTCY